MTQGLRLVLALSVTQVIGWATAFYALALLAQPISVDLGLGLPVTLAGSSLFLATLAVASRAMAKPFERLGAGPMLIAGSAFAAVGFAVLAMATGLVSYAAGWVLVGVAGAAMLTTAANSMLVQVLGADAKRMISGMMLITGLAGSIGLPITALLLEAFGWRGTLWVFAALHLGLCTPLHLWVNAQAGRPAPRAATLQGTADQPDRRLFRKLAVAVSLIGFVTWGFAIVVVELLQACGLTLAQAVAAAAITGVASVAARAAEFLFARAAPATVTAVWATAGLCLSLAILFTATPAAAWVFVILFGAASGSMSVARATLPLELFDPAAYAGLAARLALPMNLAFATAAPVFGLLLTKFGARAVLALALTLAIWALVALISLRQLAQHKGRAMPARPAI